MLLFDEFCNWAIKEQLDLDDDDDAVHPYNLSLSLSSCSIFDIRFFVFLLFVVQNVSFGWNTSIDVFVCGAKAIIRHASKGHLADVV